MATNYDINYDDPRFQKVESEKSAALNEVDNTFGGMIGDSDKFFDAQIAESQRWKDEQTKLQKEQNALTVEKIEQQKDQAHKDYTKEQSGAYVDWQKQSGRYGANAEAMAAQGMQNTGFSESAQVSMYNTYQNRVATARESYNRAVLNYDNSIKEAMLQNSSILAEIAHNAFVEQAQLALDGFQYKNQLVLDKFNKEFEVKKYYSDEYQRVLDQLNTENALAENVRQFDLSHELDVKEYEEGVRQFNESQAQRVKEFEESIRQFDKSHELKVKEYKEGIRQFNEEIARLKAKDANEHKMEIEKLELQKKSLEHEMELAEKDYQLEKAKLEEEKRQFDKLHTSSGSSGGGGTKINKTSGGSKGGSKGGSTASSRGTSLTKNVVKEDTPSEKKSGNTVDMNSVLSLGYGPISAAKAYQLVQQGLAETYTKNGKTYFRKSAFANKQKSLFNMLR